MVRSDVYILKREKAIVGRHGLTSGRQRARSRCAVSRSPFGWQPMDHTQASTNMAFAKLDICKLFRSNHRLYLNYSDHWPRQSREEPRYHVMDCKALNVSRA
jgi:hypothetical protein